MNKIILVATITLLCACKQPESVVAETTDTKQQTTQAKACTKDAKVCPDGSSVARNPNNNCEFFDCPDTVKDISKSTIKGKGKGSEVMCTADVKECPDGTFVGRDSHNKCQFKPCK